VLRHKRRGYSLRGLFIPLSDTEFLFFCSVEIVGTDGFNSLGVTLDDFSPADPTPDIIILHRFREMQVQDQQTRIEELRNLMVARDTSDRHANTDMLTGIGNRRMFWKLGTEMMTARSPDHVVAILLLDLDGFKKVNDSFGHDVGDAVLVHVAERCGNVVGEQGIVSRLGGDEFVVLIRMKNQAVVEEFVEELMHTIVEPMICAGRHLSINVSMGVSMLDSEQSIDEAIQYADLAMYHGRKKSKGIVNWFTPEMRTEELFRKSLVSEIKSAIKSGQILPFYQPIVDLRSQCIHGYEALARWQHPVHGMIYPDTFIELAVEAGCLHELDYVVLESALDQLAQWQAQGHELSVHVNMCGTSVRKGLDAKVMSLLSEREIHCSDLTLELTETTLLDFESDERAVLDRLSESGINIQLDDFGTGFSSLTHLHEFPVDGLKIDRSFLFGFPFDGRNRALIESVMGLARGLNMTVVTEGIETQEQRAWIEALGCQYGQGYHFGKPVAACECIHKVEPWTNHQQNAA